MVAASRQYENSAVRFFKLEHVSRCSTSCSILLVWRRHCVEVVALRLHVPLPVQYIRFLFTDARIGFVGKWLPDGTGRYFGYSQRFFITASFGVQCPSKVFFSKVSSKFMKRLREASQIAYVNNLILLSSFWSDSSASNGVLYFSLAKNKPHSAE